jgi:hypothetical protein
MNWASHEAGTKRLRALAAQAVSRRLPTVPGDVDVVGQSGISVLCSSSHSTNRTTLLIIPSTDAI